MTAEKTAGLGPYGESAKIYFAGGWANPIPVREKRFPVSGYTGYGGSSVSWPDIETWIAGPEAGHNVGLRMAGTIAIDIDAHDGEIGNETITRAQARLGELPATWASTSRGQGASRILIYKLPIGCTDLAGELGNAEKHMVREFGPNVEILHRGHRYAIVWPSVHPETRAQYRWYLPNGELSVEPPKTRDLAELPMEWWEFLTAPVPDEVTGGLGTADAYVGAADGGSSLFGQGPKITVSTKTVEQAAGLLIRERDAFVALTDAGNGRTQKLNNLALLAGHGVPDFWSREAAEETLMAAARESGYVSAHGERTALVQVQRGLTDGARDPWAKVDVTYTQSVEAEPVSTGRLRKAMLRRSEIHALPDPVPLIEDVIYRDSIVLLSGKFGTYKSFVAVSWAASLATGREWFGHRVPHAVPVIYAAAEGAAGIRRRLDAWEVANEAIPDELYLIPLSVRINRPADMVELDEIITESGAQVIIFDTLHMSTPGVDENDAGEMGKVMETLSLLREKHGVTCILPHHTGHGGERARGSSSIEDDADTAFVIKIEGEDRGVDNPRTLVHRKTKDAALNAPVVLKLELMEGTKSGYVKSADAYERAAGEGRAPDPGQESTISEPAPWTWTIIPDPKSELRRRILQTLADVAGEVGRTEAQVRTLVADRWHRGETGRGVGKLNVQAFQKAWTAVVALPSVVNLGGKVYGVDPLCITSEMSENLPES